MTSNTIALTGWTSLGASAVSLYVKTSPGVQLIDSPTQPADGVPPPPPEDGGEGADNGAGG